MSFAADITRLTAQASAKVNETRRAVVISLFSSIIRDTPVDTGRARGNWQTNIGKPADGTLGIRGAGEALAEVTTAASLMRGDQTVYLRNNLPYINRLEYGWSKQQPAGMVRRNVARFTRIISDATKAGKL